MGPKFNLNSGIGKNNNGKIILKLRENLGEKEIYTAGRVKRVWLFSMF